MRRALALPLVFCAACNTLDASRPIAILPAADFTPQEKEVLQNAADCWNMQFGTQLVVDGAHDPEQTIDVVFSDFVCGSNIARTDPWLPVRISLCKDYFADDGFKIALHELGHALNIWDHADDPQTVMGKGLDYPSGFTFADADCTLFYAANPDMPRTIACGSVTIYGGKQVHCVPDP